MKRSTLVAAVLVVVGCKSGEQKEAAPKPTAPAAAAPAPAPAEPSAPTEPAAPAAPTATAADAPTTAPAITVAELTKKGLKPFVDAKRGVWVVGKKTTQLCGGAVNKELTGWTKRLDRGIATIQAAAAGVLAAHSAYAFDCERRGDRATCKVAGLPDPGDQYREYSFVFVAAADGNPVLASVLLGPSNPMDAPVTSCPAK